MSSDTASPAVNTAAKKAGVAAAKVSEVLPTVVETTEFALDVPTKVVLNQRLVVVAAFLGGSAVTAGAYWTVKKVQAVRAAKKLESDLDAVVVDGPVVK